MLSCGAHSITMSGPTEYIVASEGMFLISAIYLYSYASTKVLSANADLPFPRTGHELLLTVRS